MTIAHPRIALTLGDPAGVGPELAAKILCSPGITEQCEIVVVGDPGLLQRAFDLIGKKSKTRIETIALSDALPSKAQRGAYLFEALKEGVEQCLSGQADGIVTAPISKAALHAAGHKFPGHTEILGSLCNTNPVMMLTGGGLRVVPLTTHCALTEVFRLLTIDRVISISTSVHNGLVRDFGIDSPRICLTGLNPHAGESGLFGTEEIDVLNPAAGKLRENGIDITDAIPADTAAYRAYGGEFDVVVCPTHDQALIPIKLIAFSKCVNVTLNLPIVRTSPGHGTAFDIAWKGTADESSMAEAMQLAIKLVLNRKKKR